MTPTRYQELREAGPVITAKDHELLKDFRPVASRMWSCVYLALADWKRLAAPDA